MLSLTSILHEWFYFTIIFFLNPEKAFMFDYVYLTVQLNTSHLFTRSQMIKQFYFK